TGRRARWPWRHTRTSEVVGAPTASRVAAAERRRRTGPSSEAGRVGRHGRWTGHPGGHMTDTDERTDVVDDHEHPVDEHPRGFRHSRGWIFGTMLLSALLSLTASFV